jgi:DNA-binding response OmpR family regulator
LPPACPQGIEDIVTVLVVVLDNDLRVLIKRILEASGCRVLVAGSETEAFELANSTEIDLLLTEVTPSIHGAAIAERLRARTPVLPVLYVTDHPGLGDLDGEKILEKPFSRDDLTRAIAAVRPDQTGL